MLSCGRFFALSGLLTALTAFFLGLMDRPPFVATTAPDLVAVVALSDDRDIGGNIMRLLEGTIKGIRASNGAHDGGAATASHSHNKRALMGAASRYGSPLGAEYLSVGLFLDDPKAATKPRWAIGYAVDVPYDQAQAIAAEIGTVDGSNVVRAVRISLASTLSARVPWRTVLTPMVGPRLHWPRGMDLYRSEGRATTCGRHQPGAAAGGDCAIAMEAYVTGPKGSREWIDYTIVMGDTTTTFDDLYPEAPATELEHQQEAQQPVPPEVPDTEPEPEQREVQETVGDVAAAEPDIEPTPQEAQESVVEADAAPEIEPPREEVPREDIEAAGSAQAEPEATGEFHAENHEQVPPIEPEEVAAEADVEDPPSDADRAAPDEIQIEAHSLPDISAEDPEEISAEVPPHEDSHASQQQEEAVEESPSPDSSAHYHEREVESDGNALDDAQFEGEEESEHDSGEHDEEFADEEGEEGGEEDESDVNDEHEEGEGEYAEEDEEEYFDEEDEGGEYSEYDEEDEIEHFDDEEGHDEF